jgi:hypothetical protein
MVSAPECFPVYGEAGNYVERYFFGGVMEGWWVPGTVGRFDKIREVGIKSPRGPCIISQNWKHSYLVSTNLLSR